MVDGAAGALGDHAGSALRPSLLPPPPPAVPADLTRATARYKRHAWLAVGGLVSFVGLYVSLTGWFCFTSVRLFSDMTRGRGGEAVLDFVGGALCALLGAFLLSALFFIKSGGKPSDLEVTAAEEPALFAFLNALADRAGAQRPHRVFLSMRVNAAVFYDLSLINLLFPSKKNLEIGLGLVNTLNLSEMTAVLAHEFGHFAQRSMAVGRWVYMAQQVAGQIVASRSWLDRGLATLSRIDLRVAWIGWLMRLVVWSIRSLLDTAFGLVILAQRALGREMEFQADLVSVSLTGSDALVHALHRLGAADGAWSHALAVASSEAAHGRAVPDLFALQTRIIQRMSGILNEPEHGASPRPPSEGREHYRVFELELAEPPRMWSTHPANRDREDNAKRVYVPSALDERPAFCLFSDPEGLRHRATARLLDEGQDKPLEPLTPEAALAAVDRRFDRPHLDPRYRGAYLGRSIVLHEKAVDGLYAATPAESALGETLSTLYPESLAADLRDLRLRQEEHGNLEALRDGLLDAPGGVIRHRGQVIARRSLVSVLAQVTRETEAVRARVEAHDRLCRSSHLAAARALGQGWPEYLGGLLRLHHYVAHAEADLDDARGHLANVFAVVTADGRVSSRERKRLVLAGVEVHAALSWIFDNHAKVHLPAPIVARLLEKLGAAEDAAPPKNWGEVLPKKFALPLPSETNIGDFLTVIDSWVNATLSAVGALERVSLELLIEAEAHVARAYLDRFDAGAAPEPPLVPERYATLCRGQERSRQKRLGWWDRFQLADGFVPSTARLVVAGGILAGVLGFGGSIGHPTLTIVNGLGTPVVVEIQGKTTTLLSEQHRELSLERADHAQLTAKTPQGQVIETRDVALEGSAQYVYNVAGATALVEWTAVYGKGREVPERRLGAPSWLTSNAQVLFEQPPKTLSTKSGSGTRTVLSAVLGTPPYRVLGFAQTPAERARIVAAHALWDAPEDARLNQWLRLAAEQDETLIERRLEHYPTDMSALRQQQDLAPPVKRAELCQRAREQAQQAPADLDRRYLALRCNNRGSLNGRQALLDEYRAHPSHPYLAQAAGWELARRRDYRAALEAYASTARSPLLREEANVAQARLLRLLGDASEQRLQALAEGSDTLAMLLSLETPDGEEGPLRAYGLLARGELDQAVAAARGGEPELYASILPLAAASEGASGALIARALAFDGAPPFKALGPMLALAERQGQRLPRIEELVKRESMAQALLPFTRGDFLASKPEVVEARLRELPSELQAFACVSALVRDAERAPADCRELAKAALFASERPYFR